MTLPLRAPFQLSHPAQLLYSAMTDRRRLDYDPLAAGYVPVKSAADLSHALREAVNELEQMGLATFDPETLKFGIVNVHPAYTVAEPGSGDLYIEVRVVDGTGDPTRLRDGGALLAALPKASLQTATTGPWPIWQLVSYHRTARDADHDTARNALLRVANPALTYTDGIRSEYVGVLVEARLYPIGQTAVPVDVAEDDLCDACPKAHPFAEYLPPRRRSIDQVLPLVVTFTVGPKKSFPGH